MKNQFIRCAVSLAALQFGCSWVSAQTTLAIDFERGALSPKELLQTIATDDSLKPDIKTRRVIEPPAESAENTDLRIGDKVLASGNQIATVRMIFSNGKAKVKFDRPTGDATPEQFLNIQALSKAIDHWGEFKVNDVVLASGNRIATVQMIFSNGKAKVKFDRPTGDTIPEQFLYIQALSRAIDHWGEFKVNDVVLASGNQIATVRMIFSNGKAKVKFDGPTGDATPEQFLNIQALSKAIDHS